MKNSKKKGISTKQPSPKSERLEERYDKRYEAFSSSCVPGTLAFQALVDEAVEQGPAMVAERWRRVCVRFEVVSRSRVLYNIHYSTNVDTYAYLYWIPAVIKGYLVIRHSIRFSQLRQ